MYNLIPNNFSYKDAYANAIQASRSANCKEYYLRLGAAGTIPAEIKLLNFYLLLNNRAVYIPGSNLIIKRSTGLEWIFNDLARVTSVEDPDNRFLKPFYFSKAQRDSFGLTDTVSVRIIEVIGQIQDTFETHIPRWAQDTGATEQLGISLALKLSPKHRIRVYVRNKHIIVFTTKGVSDAAITDWILYRKLWACLPLLCNWSEDTELVELCKALDRPDPVHFWNLLETAFTNNPIVRDLKYSAIIQTFNSMATLRREVVERQIAEHLNNADRLANAYAKALEDKRVAERQLMELIATDKGFSTDTIKLLVDKKICYDLDTSQIHNADNIISFRCSAPLLSYDKDAARVVYNKRIETDTTLATLFKLLFLDEKVMLMMNQAIDVRLARGTITARQGYTRLYTDLNQSFPNPHHYHYNCWGSYTTNITKLIHEYKLEEMFYQIKAATGSLNFTDYPVIGSFIEMLEMIVEGDYNPRCFYWYDENCSTPHNLEETLTHFTEEVTE
jgi:hypothetical protein